MHPCNPDDKKQVDGQKQFADKLTKRKEHPTVSPCNLQQHQRRALPVTGLRPVRAHLSTFVSIYQRLVSVTHEKRANTPV
jgi:hypothetical protein